MKTFPMPGGSPVWHGNLASEICHPATSKSRIKRFSSVVKLQEFVMSRKK